MINDTEKRKCSMGLKTLSNKLTKNIEYLESMKFFDIRLIEIKGDITRAKLKIEKLLKELDQNEA